MKNRVFLSFITIVAPFLLMSQAVEITPFAGYMFGGKAKFIQGEINVRDNVNFGIVLDIPVDRIGSVEVFWSHMDSQPDHTIRRLISITNQ